MQGPELSLVERGKRAISVEKLWRLSVLYERSSDWLLGLTDDPVPRWRKP